MNIAEAIEALRLELRDLRRDVLGQAAPRSAYTPQEAAERLGVSLTTLKRMLRAKKLGTCVIGERRMVPASELDRLTTPGARPGRKPMRRAPVNGTQDLAALRRAVRGGR